jgi:flagellar hook protein FlgE
MTISSSLNAGVTGLFANASRLAAISDNIANSETTGYKRADTDFASMVLTETAGSYVAGGVRTTSFRHVDQKASLIGSTNPTDIAVSGRGMLPVTTLGAVANGGQLPFLMTATGSFRPDDQGYLTTPSGLVLLGWAADPQGTIPSQPRDSAQGLVPVQVNSRFAAAPTTAISLGVNLPAADAQAAFLAGTPGTTLDLPIEYFDPLGASQTLTASFTPTGAAANEWQITFADAGGTVSDITVTFDATSGSGGAVLGVAGPDAADYSALTGRLAVTLSSGDIVTVDIGAVGESDNLTQLAGDFAPLSVTKDGAPVGTLTRTEIDENGFLRAIYDTGYSQVIYQIPLANVPNLNGLAARDNQTFAVTPESGQLYLWDAGDGPTGTVEGYALEESTTDIAGELTQLIQTQRAYSSNATIIRTVDEMLQETTNLKR